MLNSFELLTPKTLSEAIKLYSEHPECKVLAGGTDIFVEMHAGKEIPCLLDIKEIDELKGLSWSETGGLCFGALTTFDTLEKSELVRKHYPALVDSISQTASTQIRMRGTVAGNICTASPAGDSTGVLLAYGAMIRMQGPKGERTLPINEFFVGYKTTALKSGEIVTHITLPAPKVNTGSASTKLTRRKAMDIGILGSAVEVVCDSEDTCISARIALLSAAPTPIRVYKAEEYLVGKKLTEEVMNQAAELAYEVAQPKTWRSSEEYSRDMVRVIVPQTIKAACDRMKKGVN
jgi:CO/xanthine dehydrogenase FAD-binding subunit